MSVSKPFATPADVYEGGGGFEPPRYCMHCGAEFLSPSNFCTRCGKKAAPESEALEDTAAPCRSCGRPAAASARHCTWCGRQLGLAAPVAAPPRREGAEPTDAMGSVTTIVASGDRGPAFPLALSGTTLVGRSEGDITFASDRYLSPRHFELQGSQGQIVVRDLGSHNGTFLRIRKPALVGARNLLLVGHQLLRVRQVKPVGPSVDASDTVLRGSAVRATEWALEQLGPDGQVRDVHHLGPTGCTVGRSRGDIRYPLDTFLSTEHTRLELANRRLKVSDLGSANGTWLRLEMPYALQPDDELMAGFTILHFHLPKTF